MFKPKGIGKINAFLTKQINTKELTDEQTAVLTQEKNKRTLRLYSDIFR